MSPVLLYKLQMASVSPTSSLFSTDQVAANFYDFVSHAYKVGLEVQFVEHGFKMQTAILTINKQLLEEQRRNFTSWENFFQRWYLRHTEKLL